MKKAAATRQLSDVGARLLYGLLIEKSWEGPEHFELYQGAWNTIAQAYGIKEIKDNGHGRVVWVDASDD